MGPLFTIVIAAILAGMGFCCALLVLRLFLKMHVAVWVAMAFVIGAGAGGALAVGALALIMKSSVLHEGSGVTLYLTAIAVSALLGGVALSWLTERRLRFQ